MVAYFTDMEKAQSLFPRTKKEVNKMEINLIQGHSQHVCVRAAGISGFICLTPPGFCQHPHSTHSERKSRQCWGKSDTLCPLSSLFNFKELPLHSYLYCRQIHDSHPPSFPSLLNVVLSTTESAFHLYAQLLFSRFPSLYRTSKIPDHQIHLSSVPMTTNGSL